MKGLLKKLALCFVAFFALLGIASCGECPECPELPKVETAEEVAAAKAEALTALNDAVAAIDKNAYSDEDVAVIDQIAAYGNKFIDASTTLVSVADSLKVVLEQLEELLGTAQKYASGAYSFVASSYTERTEILAVLEKYAVEHFLTGFTFMDDGGYTLYSPDIKKGTDDYILGYGYGILSDGQILNPLATETNDAWKYYYHSFQSEDPTQINYGDDKGSVVGGLVGYVSGSYWGTKMNDTKDGYVWYSELAKEKPVPVNANEKTGLASIYEWKLKTEKDGFVYNTLTTNETLAKYAGQGVKAEDYLTSYKMLFTQANGWARGAETLDGAGAIKGVAAYYNQSANGYNATAWENVGLKVEERDGEWVMTVEFVQPCSEFYAMYYMASSIHAPLPESFVTDLGKVAGAAQGEEWAKGCALFGKTNIELGLTPVDTFLSTGPYVLEAWETEKQIVFKKNALYEDGGRYQIAGIHYNILTAAKTDNEAGLKEFLAGKIHACGVPSTQLEAYKNDPRAVFVPGESNFKLNVNSCDEETWEFLFGENGLITQTAEEDYWDLKPAMSNRDFLLGLSYALDRKKVSDSLGVGPMIDYFGNGYLSDPENGIVYNQTEAHKNAIADLIATGDGYGYDKETAIAYFQKATAYFLENGIYNEGDTIEIEIAWMYQSQIEPYGAPIAECFESVFNDPQVCENKLALKINNMAVTNWSDVYYNKMMVGQYDLAFGSISGNTLNPLNFLEVLKSDNSSGFTLNWGAITSDVNLEYNGELWSFDSLWQAAETGGYFEKGEFVASHATEIVSAELNADGTVTMVLDSNMLIGVEGVEVKVEKAILNGYDAAGNYTEFECEFTVDEEGIVTVTIAKADYEFFRDNNAYADMGHYVMMDLVFANIVLEVPASGLDSCDFFLDDLLAE